MIFASDLDRTLIYSKKFINSYKNLTGIDPLLLETKDDIEISYISKEASLLLKKISSKVTFIPITTRSIEQYKRINFYDIGIEPKIAITSNGGTILLDNKIDLEWNKIITNQFSSTLTPEEMVKELDSFLNGPLISRHYICDNFFIYCILNNETSLNEDTILELQNICSINKYILSIQERKIYFIPEFINKSNALLYLQDKLNTSVILSAGDSNLDIPLLKISNLGFIPKHGGINHLSKDSNSIFSTESEGIFASEEILRNINNFINI